MPPPAPPSAPAPPPPSSTRSSSLVAAAILLSRVAGLVREAVFSQVFGLSPFADAYRAASKLPNLLQNLLGEGTLSASFIPVYAELLEQGRREEAGRVAGAVFALLAAIIGAVVLLGVLLAPLVVPLVIAFTGEKLALTITMVRILFGMTGMAALSAWSLGILNSHRRFFLPYFAPVLWNASVVAAMLLGAWGFRLDPDALVLATAWGAFAGGFLQFAVQVPGVWRVEPRLRVRWDPGLEGVRETLRNAGPAILGRGVVQVSGYLDTTLASMLASSALAALSAAQTLYVLPISLFGMSVAAAELPELARQRGAASEALRDRTNAAMERVLFYAVPSCAAFVALGDVIVGALYQRGAFDPDATRVVWLVLIAYSIGLVASTSTRLLSSAFFALRDTRTPARVAALRVVVSTVLGVALMTQLEAVRFDTFGLALPAGALGHLGVGVYKIGAVGLAAGAGLAAWVEWVLLRAALARRIGPIGVGAGVLARLGLAAGLAAVVGLALKWLLPPSPPLLLVVPVCGGFGLTYLGVAAASGLGEAARLAARLRRR